jgi:hypothetical protein
MWTGTIYGIGVMPRKRLSKPQEQVTSSLRNYNFLAVIRVKG